MESETRNQATGTAAGAAGASEKSRLPLEAVLDLSPTGAVLLDGAGRVVWFNQAASGFFDLEAETVTGRVWQTLLATCLERPVADTAGEVVDVHVRASGGRPGRWLEQRSRSLDGGRIVYYVNVTDHKEIEEALQREQELLQKLLDRLPVMITLYDPAIQRLEGNRAFQELIGWSNEELEIVDIMEVAYPDQDYREEVRQFMTSLQGWRDLELTARDGSIIHSRWANIRLSDERQVGIGLDVRAQKKREEALLESEARFRRLLEEAPAGIVTYDQDGVFQQVNNTFTRITGYCLEDIPHMDVWLQRAYRDRAEAMRPVIGHLPQHDEPFQQELQIWTKSNERRTFLVSSVSLEQSRNRRLRMSTYVDITELKAAEAERERLLQALAEERGQLRQLNETLEQRVAERTRELVQAYGHFYTLFHASPVPKVITRLEDGLFRYVNTAYEHYFGYQESELAGRTTRQMRLWPDLTGHPDQLDRLRQEGSLRNVEFRVQHASGDARTVLASITLFEMEGEVHTINAFIDISDRIRAEQQIRHLASELTLAEQRERRRIAQILHDDVQQMLVAHRMTLDMLAADSTEETRPQLQEAAAFADEIIEATRSLSGELATPAIRSEHLRDGLSWLASHMEDRYQLHVDVDVDKHSTLSEHELRELVVHFVRELLFNVVKHAGVRHARLRATERDGWVVIEVEDDGQGFDVSTVLAAGVIPDSFGLYSIKERLELFGGTFHVRSAPGEGTEVTITIPNGKDLPEEFAE